MKHFFFLSPSGCKNKLKLVYVADKKIAFCELAIRKKKLKYFALYVRILNMCVENGVFFNAIANIFILIISCGVSFYQKRLVTLEINFTVDYN